MVFLVTKNRDQRIAVYDSLPKALAAIANDVYSQYLEDGLHGITLRVEDGNSEGPDITEWEVEATADGVELDNYIVEKIEVK